jgi:predicted amidohydrolase YtcJ
LQFTCEQLAQAMLRGNKEHLDMQVHLVGDRAFRTACDAAEAAQGVAKKRGMVWDTRIKLLHCELIDPQDMDRPGKLGLYIDWSPQWAGGGAFGDAAKLWLGEERYRRMYRFNPLIDSGAVVGYSSDIVDVEEKARANPWLGMQIGSTGLDPKEPLGKGVRRIAAADCLSVQDLLMGYTINNARAMRLDDKYGSLTAGKRANLIVLSEDPFAVPEHRLSAIKPLYMLWEGRELYNDLE